MASVLLATSNRHKIAELRYMLDGRNVELIAPSDIGLMLDVEESGTTFEENARLKAEAFTRASGYPTLADDSGLEVDALGGEPGIYSARYGGPDLDDADRVQLVLERLRGVPPEHRGARFVAVVALAAPGRLTEVFHGDVEGFVTKEPRGAGGFGYDPIFHYPAFTATFAEVSREMKAAVSHRGRAMAHVVQYLAGPAGADILGQR